MKSPLLYSIIFVVLFSCKTTENGTGNSTMDKAVLAEPTVKPIIVDGNRKPSGDLDFSVLKWSVKRDTLIAIVRYSGGCKEHNFNAYFSGEWLKSLPAQAVVELEHINLENDPCRSIIKDMLKFDMTSIQYTRAKEIRVKWSGNSEMTATYRYGEK
jgi:hypothetical protein